MRLPRLGPLRGRLPQSTESSDTSPPVLSGSSGVASVIGRGAPSPAPRAKPAANLNAEAKLLAEASGALGNGRAARALELLDKHERDYANGVLAEERTAARVLALCEIGRTAEARRQAELFLRSAPRSPLVPRVRSSCAFAPSKAAFDTETEIPAAGHRGEERTQ